MIEKFCSGLPIKISRPMYNEYENRLKDINFLISNYEYYSILKEDSQAIKLILALSVFYKRVIANINGATVFAGTVFNNSDAKCVKIGTYELTPKERDRIIAITINYRNIVDKYRISHDIITSVETRELINRVRGLKLLFDDLENKNLDSDESI